MKTYISLVICTIFLVSGCNLVENDQLSIEMAAFNSLTKEEKNKIPVSPKDSTVKEITVSEELGQRIGEKFIGKTIYAVTFNNTENDSSGKLVVYIDRDKETMIGKGYEKKS